MAVVGEGGTREEAPLSTADFIRELTFIDDLTLVNATVASLESGRLTPLLKEELWCRIQCRRLSEGKDELLVDFSTPAKNEPRPEELVKLDRRREQNRRAARKFREKKRCKTDVLLQETERLQKSNTSLRAEISELDRERSLLRAVLAEHTKLCLAMEPDKPPP